jgi:hypothetical protein
MRHLFSALLLLSIAVSAPAAGPIQGVARRFVLNFSTNRLEAATSDFNEQMKATVTPAVLVTLKEQLDRDFGHFRAVGAVRESTSGRFPLVELTAQFEKGPALFQVTFDGEGRIGALHFGRVESSNPELERAARQVLDDFNARRFAEIARRFDQKMSAQLPLPALESLHANVTEAYGAFKAVTEVRYAVERDLRVVSVFATYEKQPMLFECVFNAAGRVVGWSFRPPKTTISGS